MKFRSLSLLPALVLVSFVRPVDAANRIWTSTAGGGANWNAAANWGGTAPLPNDTLQFNAPVAGGTRTTNNDFAAGTQFNGITVNANLFTLGGNSINLGGNVAFNSTASSSVLTMNLATVLLQNTDIFVAPASSGTQVRIDWNGAISGNFGITKSGGGTLRLQTVTATYTGDTVVNLGTFDVNFANWMPSGTGKGNLVVSSAAFFGIRASQNINGLNDGTGGGGEVSSYAGSRTLTIGNGDASGSFSGKIINGTGMAITKVGTGMQTLSGANTFAGSTQVNGGTLYANASNAANNRTLSFTSGITVNTSGTLRSSSNALFGWDGTQEKAITVNTGGILTADAGADVGVGTVTLAGGALANAGASTDYGSWRFDNSGDKLAVTENSTASAVNVKFQNGATIDVSATKNLNFTGTITNTTLGGASSIVKTGAGTLTLNGVNTYTGTTLITGGTLALGSGGSISNSSSVSLGTVGTFDVSAKSGYTVGTLIGSGNVIGAITVSTQLAIGNSPGTTNFNGNLTLGASSTYVYDMTGSASPGAGSADLGLVTGNLTITLGSILDLVELGTYNSGNKFTLFSYSGTQTGTFAGTADDAVFFDDLANPWRINYNDTTAGVNGGAIGVNYVTITAVPEPASVLLGGIGLLALLRRRRK